MAMYITKIKAILKFNDFHLILLGSIRIYASTLFFFSYDSSR